MKLCDRTQTTGGVEALVLPSALARPQTKAEEFAEQHRRRISFRKWIADYEARQSECDESTHEVWY
ncbi:hypothetical protein [Cupriavidus pampae]|uniref:Uncharacterized protein n=1 Tax=Cupriavidus pampae TaxID=659251 RepID=A0ABM8X5H4_9BURK|nr:hypothetical protein [Cupriavidus pampae]CAG9175193.1 hypothetical protein LMG32289_03249 [Cupriavidus pampae]